MSVWSSQTKNSSSWTPQNKSTGGGLQYLLLEDGFFLLQENSDKLILEQSSGNAVIWGSQTKS